MAWRECRRSGAPLRHRAAHPPSVEAGDGGGAGMAAGRVGAFIRRPVRTAPSPRVWTMSVTLFTRMTC